MEPPATTAEPPATATESPATTAKAKPPSTTAEPPRAGKYKLYWSNCMYGEMTLLSVTVIFLKLEYSAPFDLKNKYTEMKHEFAFILNKLTKEIIEKKLLDNLKSFLVGARIQPKEEIEQVYMSEQQNVFEFLRKYFFVSNFGTLLTFAQHHKMKIEKEFEAFAVKRDDLYSKILAKDFAREAIEDHKRMEYHGEVSCVYTVHIVILYCR